MPLQGPARKTLNSLEAGFVTRGSKYDRQLPTIGLIAASELVTDARLPSGEMAISTGTMRVNPKPLPIGMDGNSGRFVAELCRETWLLPLLTTNTVGSVG